MYSYKVGVETRKTIDWAEALFKAVLENESQVGYSVGYEKKKDRMKRTVHAVLCMVEPRGIEPLSENQSIQVSPSAAGLLDSLAAPPSGRLRSLVAPNTIQPYEALGRIVHH